MPDTRSRFAPIQVDSLSEEDQLLGSCPCGGGWTVAYEDVVPLAGRWFDSLVVKCCECGYYLRALFDVTRFFEAKSWAWSR